MSVKTPILLGIALCFGLAASIATRQFMAQSLAVTQAETSRRFEAIAETRPVKNVPEWPPKVGETYPDLTLRDTTGALVSLSDYQGKVLLIEPVGIACKACQAFAGGHEVGGLFGHKPQPGLRSMREYLEHYGDGQSLANPRLVSIQILFYGNDGRHAPTLKEAQTWSDHFAKFSPGTVVLFADQAMIGSETRAMIPGFQLVDRDFILRSEAGNPPKGNLYRELIPMVKELL